MAETPLLDGARALEALISGSDRDLPPVPRSIHQIDEAGRALLHDLRKVDGQQIRFLAGLGISAAELDPRHIDLDKPDHAPTDLVELDHFDDLDDFVERSRNALLDMAVRSAMDAAEYEHDALWRQSDATDWEKQKPRLLEQIRQFATHAEQRDAQQAAGRPAASDPRGYSQYYGVGVDGAAPVAAGSHLRSARSQKYADAIKRVLNEVGARGVTAAAPLEFIVRLGAVVDSLKTQAAAADATLDKPSLEKLSVCWQLLGHMARAVQPLVRPAGSGMAVRAAARVSYRRAGRSV